MSQALAHKNVDELDTHTRSFFESVTPTQQPVLYTVNGKSNVVLMGYDVYAEAQNRLQLLEALAKGEQEIRRGEGHDFDEVMAEAASILQS